jgi:argininosuccinate lyase
MEAPPHTAQMPSKVSPRLAEGTAPEVCEHLYGPRLARDFPACFFHLGDINQAHLLMLHAQGLMGAADAGALAAALLRIETEGPDHVPLDAALEDAYFNYEAHLMRIAGAHVGGSLHVARSRNDILSTMDRLRARRHLADLVESLSAARLQAIDAAARYADVVMPGYTHLQPAQPITFGFWLLGVAEALGRDIDRLVRLQPQVDRCPLGAGALTGTSFPIDRSRTAALLGFEAVVPHTLDAVASRDYGLEMLSSLAILSVTASRIAQDFYVWCTPEFGLVEFPDSVTGTSSIMPQKKNPFVLEYLKGKSGQISGSLAAALMTVKAAHFTHTGDGNRETMRNLWESAEETHHIAAMLDLVLRTVRPVPERMRKRAQADFGTATELADLLVRECGLSFRESHHIVGAVVRAALDDGLDSTGITAAMIEQAALDQLGRSLGISDASVRTSLDPVVAVRSRGATGGPAPEAVRSRAKVLRGEALAVREANSQRKDRFDSARAALKTAVRALAPMAAPQPQT